MSLFDDGNTVPFVARYRQEATGCLSDGQLRQLYSQLEALDRLEERRDSVLQTLAQSRALTDVMRMEIDSAQSVEVLEEIYEPFQAPRISPANLAREAGMEELAKEILQEGFTMQSAQELCLGNELEDALEAAREIMAEDISHVPEVKEATEKALKVHPTFSPL